jgi:hypothetical protein
MRTEVPIGSPFFRTHARTLSFMRDLRNVARRRWRALDRVAGGNRPPTALQRRVASHPVAAGLAVGVPAGLFFGFVFALAGAGWSSAAILVLSLAAFTCLFTLTAFAERRRQRRLATFNIR